MEKKEGEEEGNIITIIVIMVMMLPLTQPATGGQTVFEIISFFYLVR